MEGYQKKERDKVGKNLPTEQQQFRYILSKIAFTGRCTPQIGRRFHWLHTHDDTWSSRIVYVSPRGNDGFMHFTAKRRNKAREIKKKKKEERKRENRNSERDCVKSTSEDRGITTYVINGILSSLHVKLG